MTLKIKMKLQPRALKREIIGKAVKQQMKRKRKIKWIRS